MPFKTVRPRADVAYDLETLFGVVNDDTAPPSRAKRAGAPERTVAAARVRGGVVRKSSRRR